MHKGKEVKIKSRLQYKSYLLFLNFNCTLCCIDFPCGIAVIPAIKENKLKVGAVLVS